MAFTKSKEDDRLNYRIPLYKKDKFDGFIYTVVGAKVPKYVGELKCGKPEQCTGLRDNENKPIYENDILKDKDGYFCRVEFTRIGYHLYEVKGAFHYEFGRERDYRIAGNIHSGILKCYIL